MKAMKLDKKVQVKQVDRTIKNVVLYCVEFSTALKKSLLLITPLLSQGSIPAKDRKNNIVVLITSKKVCICQRIKTRDGWVSGIDISTDAMR